MSLKKLVLTNYKNFKKTEILFSPKINILIGENGVGKTNIVNSIKLLTNPHYFTKKEKMIKIGEKISEIKALFSEGEINRESKIIFLENKRSFFINEKQVKIFEFIKWTKSFVYSPKEFNDFIFFPKKRRKYIDIQISKKNWNYLILLNNFKKILKERNELLKQPKTNILLFEVVDYKLANIQSSIVKERSKFIESLNEEFYLLSKYKEWNLKIHYKKTFNKKDVVKEILKKNVSNFKLDKKLKYTSSTINQDDFDIFETTNKSQQVFSQAEKKLIFIFLILSCFKKIQNTNNEKILILDDVLNELDEKNKSKLLSILPKTQIIITSSNKEFLTKNILRKINIIEVTHGK